MSSFLRLAAVTLAATALFTTVARAQGPVSGITTTDFDFNPDDYTVMKLGFDVPTHSLTIDVVKLSPFFIGNYYLTQHYLLYGDEILNPSIPIGWPFYGHDLLILPVDILGPFPGGSSSVPVPNNPAFVGMTFQFQGIAEFITTVHLPLEPEYVLQQGITGTFF